jgi:glycosyltransferase involved in cell wall biosynthesis
MEIIVVDDYSTKDNPEEVVNLFGMDRVSFIRQPKNVGKIRNYETGLKVSKGELVHLLHGDDKIRPGFYNEMQNLFDLNQEAKAGFCRSIYINDKGQWTGITGMIQEENGIVQDILDKLYVKQHIQTPSMVVKREVYESIGTFDRRLNAMEDWEMWIRVANRFPVATSNKVLAEYRSHEHNATSETFVNGTALKIHETLYGIVDAYVDKTILEKLKAKRNKNQSEFLLMSLNQLGSSIPSAIRKKMKKRIFELNPTLKTLIRISI